MRSNSDSQNKKLGQTMIWKKRNEGKFIKQDKN